MRDLYLKFPDKETADQHLPVGAFRNVDVIGIIFEPITIPTKPDDPWPEPVATPGWHVNVRLMDDEDAANLEPFEVTPSTPYRVWA